MVTFRDTAGNGVQVLADGKRFGFIQKSRIQCCSQMETKFFFDQMAADHSAVTSADLRKIADKAEEIQKRSW